jgi:catechol 2,3-dioxygenase-like lactoylglutathione lyase family enzyme
MEAIISSLLNRFEKGSLSRRGLIQSLAMLTAAGTASEVQGQDAGIKGVKIDHVSIQVSDLPRSIAFYEKMFGLSIVSEDKPNEIVRLGGAGKVIVSLHHKSPTGLVDHFAIGVEKFNKDAVTRQLKERGADPSDNLDAGFHIVDPEGISVQVMGA